MNTPNVHAGRLERRVRRVGNETMPGIHGFCSFIPFGAIRSGAAIARYRVRSSCSGLTPLTSSRGTVLSNIP